MAKRTSSRIEAAVGYAMAGFRVHPLKGKQPRLPRGHLDASNDPDEVKAMWRQHHGANIGVVPGPSAIVLDLDGDEGIKWAENRGLLKACRHQVRTGRGMHLWFRHPGGHIGNAKLADGVDVRADAGYVVVPPSIHPDTDEPYQWVEKGDQDD